MPALRALINSACQVLGDMGLNFTGVTLDDEVTRRRMTRGDVYVLERDGALLGTVTFSVKESDGTRYGYVNVLAVAPSHQRRGVGSALMGIAEGRAREMGLDRVRLDTAIPARHLTKWYTARGYQPIAEVLWDGKTYRSVMMEKRI